MQKNSLLTVLFGDIQLRDPFTEDDFPPKCAKGDLLYKKYLIVVVGDRMVRTINKSVHSTFIFSSLRHSACYAGRSFPEEMFKSGNT